MGASESKIYTDEEQYPKLPNVYYPLANGGKPFRVRLENNIAFIDKDKRWDYNFDQPEYGKVSDKELEKLWKGLPLWNPILETPYIQAFVGKEDAKNPSCPDIGSSVLLQLSSNKYIYIGIIITELEFKEKVKDFITETGCRLTVSSWIYTTKDAINPLFGYKYPLKIVKGTHPEDISQKEHEKYKNNMIEKFTVLHPFVL